MTDKVNNIVGRIPLTGTSSHFNNNEFHIDQLLGLVRTGTVVQVVAVHVNKDNALLPPTIDVHPLVQQINGQGVATPHGTIYGIPITRNHAGNGAIINDPVVGDIGSMQIHDRDISTVKSTSKEGAPGSFRRHDLADGVFSMAMLNKTVPAQYHQFDNANQNVNQQAVNNHNTNSKNINHAAAGGNISHSATKVSGSGGNITHSAGDTITHNATTQHIINTALHAINGKTNISQLLKLGSSIAKLPNFIHATDGGTDTAKASTNLIDPPTTLSTYTLIMPTVDNDGNPLSDGTEMGISFGDNVTTLTLTGAFSTTPPTTATAGQVMNFTYSTTSSSWWNS